MTIMIVGLVWYLARSERGSSAEQLPAR
jgi:hypothetical protein